MSPDGTPASIARKDWMPFSPRALGLMVALLLGGEAAGILAAYLTRADPELSKLFATGAVTLFFGAVLGSIVAQLFAEFDRARVRRASEIEFISNVLADLKDVYDQVDRGRTLMIARQSAKTYDEQMRELIQAQVKLRNVDRALRFDERRTPIAHVREEVGLMIRYMGELTREYESSYKRISRMQSVYEAAMKRAVETAATQLFDPARHQGAVDGRQFSDTDLPRNIPWDELENLPVLAGFLGPIEPHSPYQRHFVDPLDSASHELRVGLAAQLANRPITSDERLAVVQRRSERTRLASSDAAAGTGIRLPSADEGYRAGTTHK